MVPTPAQQHRRVSRSVLVGTGLLGSALAVALFSFQVVQSWVDQGISRGLLRWVMPISVALVVVLCFALVHSFIVRRHQATGPAVGDFATAVISYAEQLYQQRRYAALVSLRNSISETIHILGFHQMRVRLGDLALAAATVQQNDLAKAWILVDDLGWAYHLLRNDDAARQNIDRAIEIARGARPGSTAEAHSLAICRAKGLRHKALLAYSDSDASGAFLDEAQEIIEQLGDSPDSRRELAQLNHARALTTATRLGIHKAGYIREGDAVARQQLDAALAAANTAARQFTDIGDLARHTKTLFLVVRLLEAKRAEPEAREARILRDQALAQSHWTTKQGISTMTGID